MPRDDYTDDDASVENVDFEEDDVRSGAALAASAALSSLAKKVGSTAPHKHSSQHTQRKRDADYSDDYASDQYSEDDTHRSNTRSPHSQQRPTTRHTDERDDNGQQRRRATSRRSAQRDRRSTSNDSVRARSTSASRAANRDSVLSRSSSAPRLRDSKFSVQRVGVVGQTKTSVARLKLTSEQQKNSSVRLGGASKDAIKGQISGSLDTAPLPCSSSSASLLSSQYHLYASLDDVANCKFKPKISKFAKELNVPEFQDRLKMDIQDRRQKGKKVPKEDPQCTFKPRLNLGEYDRELSERGDFHERTRADLESRKRNLEMLEKKLTPGFQPVISEISKKKSSRIRHSFLVRLEADLVTREANQKIAQDEEQQKHTFTFVPDRSNTEQHGPRESFLQRTIADITQRHKNIRKHAKRAGVKLPVAGTITVPNPLPGGNAKLAPRSPRSPRRKSRRDSGASSTSTLSQASFDTYGTQSDMGSVAAPVKRHTAKSPKKKKKRSKPAKRSPARRRSLDSASTYTATTDASTVADARGAAASALRMFTKTKGARNGKSAPALTGVKSTHARRNTPLAHRDTQSSSSHSPSPRGRERARSRRRSLSRSLSRSQSRSRSPTPRSHSRSRTPSPPRPRRRARTPPRSPHTDARHAASALAAAFSKPRDARNTTAATKNALATALSGLGIASPQHSKPTRHRSDSRSRSRSRSHSVGSTDDRRDFSSRSRSRTPPRRYR